jgi:hypothetical protein
MAKETQALERNSAPAAGLDARVAFQVIPFVLGFAAYVYVVGWVADWLHLAAAHLPVDVVSSYSTARILGDGLRTTALTSVAFTLLCLLAYAVSKPNWGETGAEWREIAEEHGVLAAVTTRKVKPGPVKTLRIKRRKKTESSPNGVQRKAHKTQQSGQDAESSGRADGGNAEGPAVDESSGCGTTLEASSGTARLSSTQASEAWLRIIAGFSILTVAGVLAIVVAVGLGELEPGVPWLATLLAVALFCTVAAALSLHGPLRWLRTHFALWVLVWAAALFASAPLGMLLLVAALISTFGGALARQERLGSIAAWIGSPIPWALFATVALLGFAYQAIPPVSFPGAVLATTAGQERLGGYLNRSSGGMLLAECRQSVDATSKDERVLFLPTSAVRGITVGGRAQVFDTGRRPSLLSLGTELLGLGETPTLIRPDLRPRSATCLGGVPDQTESAIGALGNVVADPQPRRPPHAEPGEPPIEQRGPKEKAFVELARRYQPTVEVSAADRNWPVSLDAVLRELGPTRTPVCLEPAHKCPPSPEDLSSKAGSSSPTEYLQFPVRLKRDTSPTSQLDAFERGLGVTSPPTLERWLTEPAILEPWKTAQVYFYYAGVRATNKWPPATRDPRLPERLETLEYWFFYQYNYFPFAVRPHLMQDAPIAADRRDVDFHQGDWEHVDVLLDPKTHMPLWLYMARHSDEGVFIPWGSPPMVLDGTHTIIRAAFGGHPSYPPNCGPQPRAKIIGLSSDWLVCGPQFAFRAQTTPLVDLGRTTWACWPGLFGEAFNGEERKSSGEPESVLDLKGFKLVPGPAAPLRQAENSDVCKGGANDASYAEEHRR